MCWRRIFGPRPLKSLFIIFQSLKAELEKLKLKEKEVMERMEEDAKDLEKMASKQNLLHQKIDECTKKIRDLGSLPSDAFDKYQVFLVVVFFYRILLFDTLNLCLN